MPDQPKGLSAEEAKNLITREQICGPDAKPQLDYPVIRNIESVLRSVGCKDLTSGLLNETTGIATGVEKAYHGLFGIPAPVIQQPDNKRGR